MRGNESVRRGGWKSADRMARGERAWGEMAEDSDERRAACGGGVQRWRAAIALRKRYIVYVRGAAVLLYPA